jgi:hypothetical protein
MDKILAKHLADAFLLLKSDVEDSVIEDTDIINYDTYEVKENKYYLKINKNIVVSEAIGYWKDKPVINYNNGKYVLLETAQNIVKINKLGLGDHNINSTPEINKEKEEKKITQNLLNSISSIIKNNKPEINKSQEVSVPVVKKEKIVKKPINRETTNKETSIDKPISQYTELLKKSENNSEQLPFVKNTIEDDFFALLDKNRDDVRVKKFFNYHTELAKKELFAINEKFAQQQMSRAMESGGGTNALQLANGGTISGDLIIDGNLTVTGGFDTGQNLTKKVFKIGNGTDTDYVINHTLGTKDVVVNVYDNNDEIVLASVKNISVNETLISFSSVINNEDIKVVIIG